MTDTIELNEPDLREQRYDRLQVWYDAAKYEEVTAGAADMLRDYPQDEGILYLLAMSCLHLNRHEEAENAAREMLAAYPDSAYGLDLMGRICHDKDDYEQAAAYFEQCIEMEPESAYYRFWLASALYNGLDRSRATRWFSHKIRPEYLSQANRAIGVLREANRLQPDDAQQYMLLALCYDALAMPEAAFEQLKTAIVLDPAHSGIHVSMTQQYTRRGDLRSAISHCEQALMLDPHDTDALHMEKMLDAYQRNAKDYYRYLTKYWKSVCSIYPHDPANWLQAIHIKLDNGTDRPLKELEAYLKLNPEDLEMQVTYGKMLHDDKRYLSAQRHFRKLDTLYPGNVHIQSWLDTISQMNHIKLYSAPVRRWLYRCLIHYPYWILLFLIVMPIYLIAQLFTRRKG